MEFKKKFTMWIVGTTLKETLLEYYFNIKTLKTFFWYEI